MRLLRGELWVEAKHYLDNCWTGLDALYKVLSISKNKRIKGQPEHWACDELVKQNFLPYCLACSSRQILIQVPVENVMRWSFH